MLFVADRNDDIGVLVQAPFYTPEYPTRKDVARYLEACRSPASMFLAIPCEPAKFRRRSKRYGVHYWGDDQNRLWVLTERDREEFSYLDIYVGPEFVGSVRVRQRAVAFDVLGSTLAVLVDRPVGPDDADGFPDRGIDWYDIGRLELRSSSSRQASLAQWLGHAPEQDQPRQHEGRQHQKAGTLVAGGEQGGPAE